MRPPDHAIGRSCGGLTTKLHLVCDGRGRPLGMIITGGNINDTTMMTAVLEGIRVPRAGKGRPRTRPDRVLADKGYPSRKNRAWLRGRGIAATISERDDQIAHRRKKPGRPIDSATSRRNAARAATSSRAASTGSSRRGSGRHREHRHLDVSRAGRWDRFIGHEVSDVQLHYHPWAPGDGYRCTRVTVTVRGSDIHLPGGQAEAQALAPPADNIAVLFPPAPLPEWERYDDAA
jgi:hypothetical protein